MATKAAVRVLPRIAKDLPSESPSLADEARIAEVAITGDYSGVDIKVAEIEGCRLERVQLEWSIHPKPTHGLRCRWL